MRGTIVGTLLALAAGGALAACGDNLGSDTPELEGASLTTDEDAPIVHTVVARDPEDRALSLNAQSPLHGTVAVDGLKVTYTPSADYHGTDLFTVTVSNGVAKASARINVTVRPVNDAPVAVADAFAAAEDVALVRSYAALLANDRDIDGDTLSVTSVQGAVNGTVSTAGTNVTFTPAANFNGMASFQYTVSDGVATSTGTVTITVGGENDPPVAVDDTATTPEDTAVDVAATALVGNDTDPDGDALTVTAVGNATGGTVVLAGGVATFTPAANVSGTATFEYTVSDGTATDTGLVTITVESVNDAPVAVDDSATTDEDTEIQLTSSALVANDTDVDGDALTVTAVGNPTNGTVVLAGGIATFTPAANVSGTATFEYTVSDGTATDTGTVTIAVTAVNDPPVATDDTATTAEDTAVVVAASSLLANDTDPEGQSLAITEVSGAIDGTVVLAGGNITFTPAANFSGTASFSYTVSDGTAIDTGVVTVTVTAVNDPPVAVADTATTAEDTALVLTTSSLLANDTDVEGQSLTVTGVSGAVNGTVALAGGNVTFTPAANFGGMASFSYTVSDGTASDTGTVTVTVTAVNDPPVAADDTLTIPSGAVRVIAAPDLLANDTDVEGSALSITAVQNPVNGTAVLGAGVVTFTPTPGFVGTASFEYVVSDGTASDVGAVTIVVAAPFCGDGTVNGSEACDDANADDTDGCTTQCVAAALCNVSALPGGDRFAVDPATGHCYAAFDDEMSTFAVAQAACAGAGGYLVTIASAAEQGLAQSVQNTAQNPWIGAGEDANDLDAVFDWVTDEAFGFASFAPGQPDDDAALDGAGDCLHLANAAGEWSDTNCNIDTFVVGRICEFEAESCGDSVLQPSETCDDGNTADGDGCSATCQAE